MKYIGYGTGDTRVLDELDHQMTAVLQQRFAEGSKFKLMATHLLGIDNSAH